MLSTMDIILKKIQYVPTTLATWVLVLENYYVLPKYHKCIFLPLT